MDTSSGNSMQGIARHGQGWRYRWTQADTRARQYSPTLTLADCKHFRAWVLGQARRVADNDNRIVDGSWKRENISNENGIVTFGEFAPAWFARQTAQDRTTKNYRSAINRSMPRIDKTHLQDLTDDALLDLERWLVALPKVKKVNGQYVEQGSPRYAPSTIVSNMTVIRAIIKDAVKQGVLTRDPSPDYKIEQHSDRQREHRYLTPGEYMGLRSCADNDVTRLMMDLLAHGGLRLGEMLGLRVSRLHLDAAKPYLRIDLTTHGEGSTGLPKGTGKPDSRKRNVPIHASLKRDLEAYLELRGDLPHDWLFPAPHRPGSFISHNWGAGDQGPWQRAVTRAIEKGYLSLRAGRPTPHDLRHSHASWLLNKGMPLVRVSKRLGHKNIIVTATVYAHVIELLDDETPAVIEDLFGAKIIGQLFDDSIADGDEVLGAPQRRLALVRR